jgi:hypothetical protein
MVARQSRGGAHGGAFGGPQTRTYDIESYWSRVAGALTAALILAGADAQRSARNSGVSANSPKTGHATSRYNWSYVRAAGDNGVFLPRDDRWRTAVQACRGGEDGGPGPILAYDINATNLVIQRNLSDGCDVSCDINPNDDSVAGLRFKSYARYIHVEKVVLGKRRIWASAIVQPSDVDETSGVLHLKAKGFAAYPKTIPWLEDIYWAANDAYEPVVEIWRHMQEDFPNGNLGVEITPKTSGVEMLPGYAFDGNLLNPNFFATFVRRTDNWTAATTSTPWPAMFRSTTWNCRSGTSTAPTSRRRSTWATRAWA